MISIHPPLEGDWKFLRPPGHHPDAFDFVQVDAMGNTSARGGLARSIFGRVPTTSFFCWGKLVVSPVDGIVIRTGDDWPDHEFTNVWKAIQLWYNATFRFRPEEVDGHLDIRPNAGNHVMIQSREGYIVFLAHLARHTLTISEGDRVNYGDIIGRVGNSGNSTMPHLHINLFDQMGDPFSAKVLPFVFTEYALLDEGGHWRDQQLSLPKPGDMVRFGELKRGLDDT